MEEMIKSALDALGVKFDAMLTAVKSDFEQRVNSLEQKAALRDNAGAGGNAVQRKTLGSAVVNSDEFKLLQTGKSRSISIEVKNTILGNVTGADGGPLVIPDRQPGIIPGAFRSLRVVEALPSGQTTSNMVEYTRELSYTNAAAETSEGEAKPESTLTFELAEAPVRTIATIIRTSKQILSDSAALQSYIDARLRYGVLLRLEQQVLNGNGTSPNISGMLHSGNFTAFVAHTGDNEFDSVNRAKYQVIAADLEADTVIMNPVDWGSMERRKTDTNGGGAYLGAISAVSYVGTGISTPTLWGLRVVLSNSIGSGSFVVLASSAVQVFEREGVTVQIFEQDADNVTKNLLTIRAEMRAALAIYRVAAIVSGTLIAA